MPTKNPKPRNRTREAVQHGRRLVGFEITPEAEALIERAADHVARFGRRSRVAGLEWLIREGAKALPPAE